MTRQGLRGPDVFEIVLSGGGIDFHRPNRPSATLTWDRISDWEIDRGEDDILLTLRGGGGDTALFVPGWSAADLGALLRQLSERPAARRRHGSRWSSHDADASECGADGWSRRTQGHGSRQAPALACGWCPGRPW